MWTVAHRTGDGAGPHDRRFAVRFLAERARRPGDRPWLLYVGFFRPHFPLLCEERYFDRYHPDRVELPDSRDQPIETQHPVVQSVRRYFCDERPLPEETVRTALAAYYGLVTFTDELIGAVHRAAEAIEDTIVLYTSDHGENGGVHGMWQKHCFYEHAARVPLVMCGPGVAPGEVVSAPVSLVDVLPTLLEISEQEPDPSLPGTSLMPLATGGGSPPAAFRDRPVFSEYHAWGMERAGYMLRKGDHKLNCYVGHEPELFDLAADPDEMTDVAASSAYARVRAELTKELRSIVDPESVDDRARANQRRAGSRRGSCPVRGTAALPSIPGRQRMMAEPRCMGSDRQLLLEVRSTCGTLRGSPGTTSTMRAWSAPLHAQGYRSYYDEGN